MDYHTKKLLGLTDKNIIFPTEWLSEKKEGGITTYVIHGRLDYTPTCCTKCGIKNEGQVIKYGTHQTTIQLLPIHSHKTVFNLKKTRFLCKECGSTFSSETSLVDRNCSISVDLKRKIMAELAINSSRKDIALRYFVSDVTILRIMKAAVKSLKVRFDYLPFVLCFDEFKAMKSCVGKMSFIFMDGQTNQILGLLESRKLAYLRTFFSRYTRQARENVQYIVMDMNAPYFELAKSIFPHAQIVTDRFHIIQHIQRALNHLRIQIMNTYRKKDHLKYKRLKRYWKLFLKDSYLLDSSHYRYDHSFKRPMTEKTTVDELLSYDSTLKLAYDTCQFLLYHYKQKDTNYFFEVVNTLDAQLPEWFRKKLTFLNKYRKGIENAFKTPYSNGALEGTNNKIKVIKRVAYGYRNFLHFRDRIYLIQGLVFQDQSRTKKNQSKPISASIDSR